jgi:hypothetical protein
MSKPFLDNLLWNVASFTYDPKEVFLDDSFVKIGKRRQKIRLLAFSNFLLKFKVICYEK